MLSLHFFIKVRPDLSRREKVWWGNRALKWHSQVWITLCPELCSLHLVPLVKWGKFCPLHLGLWDIELLSTKSVRGCYSCPLCPFLSSQWMSRLFKHQWLKDFIAFAPLKKWIFLSREWFLMPFIERRKQVDLWIEVGVQSSGFHHDAMILCSLVTLPTALLVPSPPPAGSLPPSVSPSAFLLQVFHYPISWHH